MAEGRRREAWDHTAHLLAMIRNVNRGPSTPAAKPDDFHPLRQRQAAVKPVAKTNDLTILRDVFVRD